MVEILPAGRRPTQPVTAEVTYGLNNKSQEVTLSMTLESNGMLSTASHYPSMSIPAQLFEVSDQDLLFGNFERFEVEALRGV